MSASLELAIRILDALPEKEHHPSVPELLAIALSRGLGVVPDPHLGSRYLYIVLKPPLEATPRNARVHIPVFLVAKLSKVSSRRRPRPTIDVAAFLRTLAGDLGVRPSGFKHSWFPSPVHPVDGVTIEGQLPRFLWTSPGENPFRWYDLNMTPIGSIIYCLALDNTLCLWQRIMPNGWAPLHVRRVTTDVVDIYGIVTAMREKRGAFRLDRVQGEIPFMRRPMDP